MRRMQYVLPLFSSLLYAQTVTVDVSFKMTELERVDRPLAGVPVRLVLGEVADWQGPNAGHRFVTGPDGVANFTVEGVVDRRWKMVPYAMTGLSFPKRSDHIMIAAELEQLIPTASGEYRHLQWLHTMDIDCYSADFCATSDIGAVYTRDGNGRFTRQGQREPSVRHMPGGLIMPELAGMVLTGPGYKAADFYLSPAGPDRKRWKVKLMLQRRPAPVWR
jgi:hypothetical protein